MPWSLRLSAADFDYGNPADLTDDYPPLCQVSSRRPGGQHIYYADDQGRANHKWHYKTAGGEIRCQSWYLLLHGDSLHLLHAAVKRGYYADHPFSAQQLGLFTADELEPVVLPDSGPKLEPRRGDESWAEMAERLETVLNTTLEGSMGRSGRNDALFNASALLGLQRAHGLRCGNLAGAGLGGRHAAQMQVPQALAPHGSADPEPAWLGWCVNYIVNAPFRGSLSEKTCFAPLRSERVMYMPILRRTVWAHALPGVRSPGRRQAQNRL